MKNQQLIIKSLNITELAYCNMVMECGYCWLDRRFCNDRDIVNGIGAKKTFWAWWKNQWLIRDQEYIRLTSINKINEVLEGKVRQAAIELYNSIHNPHDIKVYPNVWVRKEINEVLLQEIRKDQSFINHIKNKYQL